MTFFVTAKSAEISDAIKFCVSPNPIMSGQPRRAQIISSGFFKEITAIANAPLNSSPNIWVASKSDLFLCLIK